MEKRIIKIQHEPIRVPIGWTGEARALVIQIERVVDDAFNRIDTLTRAVIELRERIDEMQEGE